MSTRIPRFLVLNRQSGATNPDTEARLRDAMSDHEVVDINRFRRVLRTLKRPARIVAAGGDGTISSMIHWLAGTSHTLAIVPLGTFNNFARSLGLPLELDPAIELALRGRPRKVTLGRVNGKLFLEACSAGLFGESVALGESAKARDTSDIPEGLAKFIGAKPFRYELKGDLDGAGTAMSLVFSNTSSIGVKMPVSQTTPLDPYLELSIQAGETRRDIAARAISAALRQRPKEENMGQFFRFRTLMLRTKPRVRVFADSRRAGMTPAEICADVGSLRVVVP